LPRKTLALKKSNKCRAVNRSFISRLKFMGVFFLWIGGTMTAGEK
jgi:hypothetical protein